MGQVGSESQVTRSEVNPVIDGCDLSWWFAFEGDDTGGDWLVDLPRFCDRPAEPTPRLCFSFAGWSIEQGKDCEGMVFVSEATARILIEGHKLKPVVRAKYPHAHCQPHCPQGDTMDGFVVFCDEGNEFYGDTEFAAWHAAAEKE